MAEEPSPSLQLGWHVHLESHSGKTKERKSGALGPLLEAIVQSYRHHQLFSLLQYRGLKRQQLLDWSSGLVPSLVKNLVTKRGKTFEVEGLQQSVQRQGMDEVEAP